MASDDEMKRVSEEVAARLEALGIALDGREQPEELAAIEEAVERFEEAVESRGGDLMVDEGDRARASEPDDPHFALPVRRPGESVAAYLDRLAHATDVVLRHPIVD
jgi:hypothetical protein